MALLARRIRQQIEPRSVPSVSLKQYGASGSATQDATKYFQHAIDQTPDGGFIEVPIGGVFKLTEMIKIKRPMTFWGRGTLLLDDPGVVYAVGRASSFNAFEVYCPGVILDGLVLVGRNGGTYGSVGASFGGVNTLIPETQSLMFFVGPAHGGNATDCEVRNCTVSNMWGHLFKSFDGGPERIHVRNSSFTDCTNGLNLNASYCETTDCVLTRVGGWESGGSYNTISGCTFTDAYGASLGGFGTQTVGCTVRNTTITRSLKTALTLGGCRGCTVEDVTIVDGSYYTAGFPGIQQTVVEWPDPTPDVVSGKNYYRRCNVTMAPGGGIGIWLHSGDETEVEDCNINSVNGHYGMYVNVTGSRLLRNVVDGNPLDLVFEQTYHPAITVYTQGNTGGVTTVGSVTVVPL